VLFSLSPQEALDTVQIHKEDQEQAFAMLAAVLWLGNISFQVIDNGNHVEVLANEGKIDIILSKLNCQLSVLANSR
jgi:myosin-5